MAATQGDTTDGGPVVLVLSGPNLDLLGRREPAVYGPETLADHVARATDEAATHGLSVEAHQSASSAELVGLIHGARERCAAVVINPGALTHHAWELHDALAAFEGPVVECHVSNPVAREAWRHTSVVSPVATATVAGLGPDSYAMAVRAAALLLARR